MNDQHPPVPLLLVDDTPANILALQAVLASPAGPRSGGGCCRFAGAPAAFASG